MRFDVGLVVVLVLGVAIGVRGHMHELDFRAQFARLYGGRLPRNAKYACRVVDGEQNLPLLYGWRANVSQHDVCMMSYQTVS